MSPHEARSFATRAEASPTHVVIANGIGLDVLPGFGPAPDPTELLGHGIRPLLDRLSPTYDVIVVDTAPIMPVADALAIAPYTTGVVFAVSMPDADRKAVENAVALLRRLNIRTIGAVATNMPRQRGHGKAGYGYGYGYGTGQAHEGYPPATSPRNGPVPSGPMNSASESHAESNARVQH